MIKSASRETYNRDWTNRQRYVDWLIKNDDVILQEWIVEFFEYLVIFCLSWICWIWTWSRPFFLLVLQRTNERSALTAGSRGLAFGSPGSGMAGVLVASFASALATGPRHCSAGDSGCSSIDGRMWIGEHLSSHRRLCLSCDAACPTLLCLRGREFVAR